VDKKGVVTAGASAGGTGNITSKSATENEEGGLVERVALGGEGGEGG